MLRFYFFIFVTVYYKDLQRLVNARGSTPVKRLDWILPRFYAYLYFNTNYRIECVPSYCDPIDAQDYCLVCILFYTPMAHCIL